MTDDPSEPGEIRKRPDGLGWEAKPPGARQFATLSAHVVIVNDDGSHTVRPPIVYSTPDRPDYWHGWLTDGRWEKC